LFLLLLVFFVALNAQSQARRERVTAALEGIESRFGRGHPPLGLGLGGGSGAEDNDEDSAHQGLRAIGELFRTALGLVKVELLAPGADGVMEVSLPVASLFVPAGTEIRPNRFGLLDRVSEALREPPPGIRYDVEAYLSLTGPGGADPGSVPRAVALARHLVALGTPEATVAVGVEAGEPGMIRFVFSARAQAPEPGRAAR